MRKALCVLGCIACILLIVDIGLSVYSKHKAEDTLKSITTSVEENFGQTIEEDVADNE